MSVYLSYCRDSCVNICRSALRVN